MVHEAGAAALLGTQAVMIQTAVRLALAPTDIVGELELMRGILRHEQWYTKQELQHFWAQPGGNDTDSCTACPCSHRHSWGNWSSCAGSCGTNNGTRSRSCRASGHSGGNDTDRCTARACVTHRWGTCSGSCGGGTGYQYCSNGHSRHRATWQCTNQILLVL